jgi:hypothetical protein
MNADANRSLRTLRGQVKKIVSGFGLELHESAKTRISMLVTEAAVNQVMNGGCEARLKRMIEGTCQIAKAADEEMQTYEDTITRLA